MIYPRGNGVVVAWLYLATYISAEPYDRLTNLSIIQCQYTQYNNQYKPPSPSGYIELTWGADLPDTNQLAQRQIRGWKHRDAGLLP